MSIGHKRFRGFQALSPAIILGGNLISLKPAIFYAPHTKPYASCAQGISGRVNQETFSEVFIKADEAENSFLKAWKAFLS